MQLKTALLAHVIANPRGNKEIEVDERELIMPMSPASIAIIEGGPQAADYGKTLYPWQPSIHETMDTIPAGEIAAHIVHETHEEPLDKKQWRYHRDQMIVAKRLAGRTLADIAQWAGISPSRVHQILKAKGCTDEHIQQVREKSTPKPV